MTRDLLLVGGGHSHLAVLRALSKKPIPGVRLTLVSRGPHTAYSGMLPGLIAGHYATDEAHIDLRPLCRVAGARLIVDAAVGLDADAGRVDLQRHPSIAYDLVSLNIGSTPCLPPAVRRDESLTPIKPVDDFLRAWQRIRARAANSPVPIRIAIVGAGAGGVEVALAIAAALAADGSQARVSLMDAGESVLPAYSPGAQRRLMRALRRRGIVCRPAARVVAADGGLLRLQSGESVDCDEVLWITHAGPPSWLRRAGLAVDEDGFMLVDDCLRSVSHQSVFGAGDVVTLRDRAVPKSGVAAVRQGRPLADNLRRALLDRPLRRYRPQRHWLSLIGTGDGSAIAVRGRWSFEGALVWRWKTWIDRRFVQRYR